MTEVSARGRLDESGDALARIGRVVLGLASLLIGSRSGPVFELLSSASSAGVGRLVLVIPASIVSEVLDLAVPLPLLCDPESTNAASVDRVLGVLVEGITPQSFGLTKRFAHVDGVPVNLTVLETVAGQEVVLGGIRSVLEFALYADVDTSRNNVLGPDPWLAILTDVVRVGIASIELNLGHFGTSKSPRVPRDGEHDIIGILGVDFNNLFETTLGEGTDCVDCFVLDVDGLSLGECRGAAK